MTSSPRTPLVVIDSRTRAEYSEGHLESALLVDYNGGEVPAALEQLDPTAGYLLYCRSGNRSGLTVELMKQAGFSNATNLGSLQQAAEMTGLAIVQ